MAPWNSARGKVQIRISTQRIKSLREKKEALAKTARREIATLLEKGKVEIAKIKVENVINEDVYVQLLEVLEIYCELLDARFGLLENSPKDSPDVGIYEAVCAVIHAAPRTELKELNILRDMLMHKFGREFSIAVMENRDGCVPVRVTNKLLVQTPDPAIVNLSLKVIAEGYGVRWSPPDEDDGSDGGGGLKETVPKSAEKMLEPPLLADPKSSNSTNAEQSTSGPAASTTNDSTAAPSGEGSSKPADPAPALPRLIAGGNNAANGGGTKPAGAVVGGSKKKEEDEFEALRSRLDALRARNS